MQIQQKVVNIRLPKVVYDAITSKTTRSGLYAKLSRDEWYSLALLIYLHEVTPVKGGNRPFFSRGNITYARNTIDDILYGLLYDTVELLPDYAKKDLPNLDKIKEVYSLLKYHRP